MTSGLRALIFVTMVTDMVSCQDFIESVVDSCAGCEHKYTFRGSRTGIFTSPGFPDNYPERTTCCYFFHAKDEGRVRIEFDYFELEKSENGCNYDYIEISSINIRGFKEQPRSKYCGKTTPPLYISTQSKLEIIFHSDVTTNAKGFLGHYEFIDKNWHPFPPSTIGCGEGYLTGSGGDIRSPGFPGPYPAEAGCTWVLQVLPMQRILVTIIALQITNSAKCQDTNLLMLFDGHVTPELDPVTYCGQLDQEPVERREYLSIGDRLVIRFQSGMNNLGRLTGFHLSWTAVTIHTYGGLCTGFQCAGNSGLCARNIAHEQCRFCIDASLKCNELPNCGARDESDEHKCLNHIFRYVGYIGAGAAVALIIIIVIIVVCCCRRWRRRRHNRIRYHVPKNQSGLSAQSVTRSLLPATSPSAPVRTLDRSPRTSSIMYTTSFTDCRLQSLNDDNAISNHSSTKALHTFGNSKSLNHVNMETDGDTDSDVFHPVAESSATYKGHQKRPSYHMMRELCYQDGNMLPDI
ncbi:cubilin-like [Dreissena polymorpha]|uniref:CUB domain-containing protein n=1 Tax=Dreissena polymorpha TaxID=45954 RepID=A0A9D4CEH5_DREPO|nr:cubilin-like [Dreissena polymorpha]KAH3723723.1 hypothetical protein DPMN_049517 [Dreissena polymorpha]